MVNLYANSPLPDKMRPKIPEALDFKKQLDRPSIPKEVSPNEYRFSDWYPKIGNKTKKTSGVAFDLMPQRNTSP